MGKQVIKEKVIVSPDEVGSVEDILPELASKKEPAPAPEYVAVSGFNFNTSAEDPHGTRFEAGQDVPAEVIEKAGWLYDQGHVRMKGRSSNG